MKIAVLTLATVCCCGAQTVFTSDFNGPVIPPEITPGSALLEGVQGYSGLGQTGNQFGGTFLRSATTNVVTLQLTGLPAHTTVNVAFLLAAIDSLDGTGSYPSGDYFHIKLDGVTIFRESLANAVASQIQSYVPAPGAQLARRVDLGFNGPGSYFTDSAYDLGREPALRNIPHNASSLTLQLLIEGEGAQSLDDESWAMDNLVVSLGSGAVSQQMRFDSHKVTYPVSTTPYFTGIINGATPSANVTLQASTDLGLADPWADLLTLPANSSGSVSFLDVPDPSAAGSPRNFYRAVSP